MMLWSLIISYISTGICYRNASICLNSSQLLEYGNNSVQPTIEYSAEISGANISTMMMITEGSTVTFRGLPPVDSNIFATVAASNVFGTGANSIQFETEISKLLMFHVLYKLCICKLTKCRSTVLTTFLLYAF